MNKVILMGRLTSAPEVRWTAGEKSTCLARYVLAVQRRFKRDGEQDADFISCVAFGKNGEFAEKYLEKGKQIAVVGRIQTGTYEKDGQKRHSFSVVVEEHYFTGSAGEKKPNTPADTPAGFYPVADDGEEDLPF